MYLYTYIYIYTNLEKKADERILNPNIWKTENNKKILLQH